MGSLSGKTLIVTGGARGIGRAYALALAKEGGNLVLADVLDATNVVEEIRDNGGEAVSTITDISNEQSNSEMARTATDTYGSIDVLINNAAMFSETTRGPFNEVTIEEWDQAFAVNVRGVWLSCCAVYPQMIKQGGGKIINIASNTCYKGTIGFPHYVASKSAILGLTRCLATELGRDGITVNVLSPDLIPDPTQRPTDAVSDEIVVAGRPLKRTQTAEDMIGTMLYLCSSASDFVTGQSILVNGGAYLH